jgi:hypothetical protein
MEIDNVSTISTTASLSQVEPTVATSAQSSPAEQSVQDEFIGNNIDILS